MSATNDPKGPVAATSIPAVAERSMEMKDSNKLVLVIEDHATSMKLFHDLLKLRGYNVLRASNGMEGWRSACEHHPDLILMDIQLPDVSGLQVTNWLKNDETLKSIPIVAVTAFVLDDEKMLDAGCDGFISKPISVLSFMETIDRFVAEQGPDPAECEFETAWSLKSQAANARG